MMDYILKYPNGSMELSALIFGFILMGFTNVQVKDKGKSTLYFRVMLFLGAVLTIAEVLSTSWFKEKPYSIAGIHVIDIQNSLVYLSTCSISLIISFYYEDVFKFTSSKKLRFFNFILYIFYIIVIISNLKNGCISIYDYDYENYIHGKLFIPVGNLIPIYFLLYATIIFIKSFSSINQRLKISLTASTIMLVAGSVLQPLINYDISITGLFSFLSLFMLYFSMETNDYHQLVRSTNELEKTQKKAEDANTAKTLFLANMSHEIRTPLNAFLGMNDMIISVSEDAETIAYANNMKIAGGTLLSIVNDVLDISKIETGQLEIEENPYHFPSLINDIKIIIDARAKEKNLSFLVDVDDDIPENLIGDKVRIRQIIINILNNGIKYTEKGTVSLKLGGTRSNKVFNLEITVSDTGIGIKDEDIDHLFETFRRVDLEKNKKVEGTGLGLSIVKQLLDSMNGKITISSTYGKGTTFYISIPQIIVQSQEEKVNNYPTVERASGNRIAPKANILIVDDNIMNLKVATAFLKDTKANISVAEGGPQALSKLALQKYDIILLDSFMPEIDGPTVLEKIRSEKHNPNNKTPCIVVTADALSDSRDNYLNMGFDEYISKPIDTKQLHKLLFQFLRKDLVEMENNFNNVESMQNAGNGAGPLIDKSVGLEYCGNMEDLYVDILEEYKNASNDLVNNLNKYYEEKNWTKYTIYAHAMKSTSLTIGAVGLSEFAKTMEYACKAINEGKDIDTNTNYLLNNHAKLIELHEKVLKESEKYC